MDAAMIHPQRAAVKTRVITPSQEKLKFEDVVRELLERGARGVIALIGGHGAGKTVALQHLAAVLPQEAGVVLLDVEKIRNDSDAHVGDAGCVTVRASHKLPSGPLLAALRLARWDQDDLIEYLLTRHPDRCASVMKRIQSGDHEQLAGIPELRTVILDQLASDETIPNVRAALERYLERELPDTDVVNRSRNFCLNLMT